jgi:hypothetical protein
VVQYHKFDVFVIEKFKINYQSCNVAYLQAELNQESGKYTSQPHETEPE